MEIDSKLLMQRIKGEVTFKFYQGGSLWYSCEDEWDFPVPVSDLGSSTANKSEKGVVLMRWIRKNMEYEQKLRDEAGKEGV